jgi:hypothetical protein
LAVAAGHSPEAPEIPAGFGRIPDKSATAPAKGAAALAVPADATARPAPIDRHALVKRHNITWNDPAKHLLPLGNDEFNFGADGTGLQTFAGSSLSHWGWHSFPLPDGWTAERVHSQMQVIAS